MSGNMTWKGYLASATVAEVIAQLGAGAAALREVAELRARLADWERSATKAHCVYCGTVVSVTEPSDQAGLDAASRDHIEVYDTHPLRLARAERDELRARMEDARLVAAAVKSLELHCSREEQEAARRILAHPAPAPAPMFDSCACRGHMKGNVKHGPFNCIGQAPAQAKCPDCDGEGEVLVGAEQDGQLTPIKEPCPRGCKVRS